MSELQRWAEAQSDAWVRMSERIREAFAPILADLDQHYYERELYEPLVEDEEWEVFI